MGNPSGLTGINFVNGDYSVITGNNVSDFSGWGIELDLNSRDNVVTSNVVILNTAGQIRDLGVGTDVAHNIVV